MQEEADERKPETTSAWIDVFRAKLSTPMTEWLKNTLGLGSTTKTATVEQKPSPERSESPPTTPNLTPVMESDAGSNPWELPSFWQNMDAAVPTVSDTLEMQHFGPLEGLVPTGKRELGAGHDFLVCQINNPTWCDKCGDFIWGFYKQAVRCGNCNYTCHYKCRMLVTLDCRSLSDSAKTTSTVDLYRTAKSLISNAESTSWTEAATEVTELDEEFVEEEDEGICSDWTFSLPSLAELSSLIEEYNTGADGLGMSIMEEGRAFSGYVHIHMNFTRPINVVVGERPPSIYDVMKPEDTLVPSEFGALAEGMHRTITSFFLPRNTVKILQLTSDTTTREMIVNLLKKFKVADNPRKFLLYERHFVSESTLVAKLKRVPEDAFPLRLALQWGHDSGKRFVLQENDTGDIMWDAFEIPELNNFIKILAMEEEQYVWQIRQRYNLYRHYLELEMRERGLKLPRPPTRPLAAPPPPPPAHQPQPPKEEEPVWIRQESFNTMSTADSIRRTAENTLNSTHWDYYSGTL